MVFVTSKDGKTAFVMFCEKDVMDMRPGRTKFIRSDQTGGAQFENMVFSLGKTDQANLELIRRAGHRVELLPDPTPGPKESRCADCQGIMETASLFEDRCILCWAQRAKDTEARIGQALKTIEESTAAVMGVVQNSIKEGKDGAAGR